MTIQLSNLFVLFRSLSAFQQGDIDVVKECLENIFDGRYLNKDPEVFPLWDPKELLGSSELLLLRSATLQSDYSDEESSSSTSEESNLK